MPNHVTHRIVITGADADIRAFVDRCIVTTHRDATEHQPAFDEQTFDFSTLIPMPEELKNVTVLAGDNPPANAQGAGNLVEAFGAGDSTPVVKRIVLDSSRFLQNDGTINIDVASGATGKIRCFKVSRI